MRFWGCLAAFTLLVAPACNAREEVAEPTSASAPLTAATNDDGHPEVVAIVKRRLTCETAFIESFCTGALVAPGVVLTAAHCALAEPAVDIEVFAGSDVNAAGGRFHGVVAHAVHPGYDDRTFANDLALLWLDEPLAAAPVTLGEGPAVGDVLTIVGFGGDENGGGGRRRVGTSRVDDVAAEVIHTVAAPSLACGGDSGAPALKDGKLVGIVRSGDPKCAAFANATSLEIAWASFVAPRLAAPPKPARRVVVDEPLCRNRCVDDADCPSGMLCLPERDLGNLCGYATLRSGAFGETCSSNAACGSGTCAQVGAGDRDRECRCFTSCRDLPPVQARPSELEGGCSLGAPRDSLGLVSLGLGWAIARRARRRTREAPRRS